MRYFIFLLLLAAFLQTAFLPVNLCLLLLVCRSYAVEERLNYYLAFAAGIFLTILTTSNAGFWALAFLFIVKLVQAFRKLPFSEQSFTIVPVAFLSLLLGAFLNKFFSGVSLSILPVIVGAVVSLPLFIVIRLWEERFIVKPHVKLKI